MVGDPRQLSSVGPGGGFEALVSPLRRGGARADRERPPGRPRRAGGPGQLRSGDVERRPWPGTPATAASPCRPIGTRPSTPPWPGGRPTWPRAPTPPCTPGGGPTWPSSTAGDGRPGTSWAGCRAPSWCVGDTGYRAGDRIVTLAPGAGGEIVTSECGTVLAVDVERRRAGRHHGRRAHPALRPPRSSTPTTWPTATPSPSTAPRGRRWRRAHALEDGGGRELAYVKMSRARERSTVYVVADSLEQAVEDLGRSWAQSRRIGWAIDRGTPAPGLEPETVAVRAPRRCRPACATPAWWPSGRRWRR